VVHFNINFFQISKFFSPSARLVENILIKKRKRAEKWTSILF
jgi:hypothetical protein